MPADSPSLSRGLHAAAPVVAIALLIGVFFVGGFRPQEIQGRDAYFLEVAQTVEALPFRIGRFVGQDVEVQVAAQELLRPNKMMQRLYIDPITGDRVTVLIVHCGDARDMIGHYPPVCYPAHGWVPEGEPVQTAVPVGGEPAQAMRYVFSRPLETAADQRGEGMVIVNFFALPGVSGEAVLDMPSVDRAARTTERAGLGAAQFQVITSEAMSDEERAQVHDAFFEALTSVIRSVQSGVADVR